jgi:hypothetical protein
VVTHSAARSANQAENTDHTSTGTFIEMVSSEASTSSCQIFQSTLMHHRVLFHNTHYIPFRCPMYCYSVSVRMDYIGLYDFFSKDSMASSLLSPFQGRCLLHSVRILRYSSFEPFVSACTSAGFEQSSPQYTSPMLAKPRYSFYPQGNDARKRLLTEHTSDDFEQHHRKWLPSIAICHSSFCLQERSSDPTDLELPPIGWQLFILGKSQSDSTAFPAFLDTYSTRLLAEPLSTCRAKTSTGQRTHPRAQRRMVGLLESTLLPFIEFPVHLLHDGLLLAGER